MQKVATDGKLSGVKAGDSLLIRYGHYSESIEAVDRLTATMVVCGNRKFRIRDGRLVGESDSWSRSYASIPTNEDFDRVKGNRLHDKLRDIAGRRSLRWPIETLETVVKLLEETKIEKR
jgi:hypothetical protein